jgi:hypothetical protein
LIRRRCGRDGHAVGPPVAAGDPLGRPVL